MARIGNLPGPIMELWEWQYLGACRDKNTEMFFHPEGERGPARRRRAAEAKKVCATCPVREECLSHSLTTREPYGIWGGLTEEERRRVLREASQEKRAS